MNCPSETLGVPGWERREMMLVRDLMVLGWESTGSALGSLRVLVWGLPESSGLEHLPWLERLIWRRDSFGDSP